MSENLQSIMFTSPSHTQNNANTEDNNSPEKSEVSPKKSQEPCSSDDDARPFAKRTQYFSDNESEIENKPIETNNISPSKPADEIYDHIDSHKNLTKKSRIKHIDTSDSDNNNSCDEITIKKKKYESSRSEDKKRKLKEKFKSLISHQTKIDQEVETQSDEKSPFSDDNSNENSDDKVSCLKIKQKVKKSVKSIYSICDPDTSDEDSNNKSVQKQKSKLQKPRSMKPTSPKPMRMSAKQAMENMHKIKSESNRMLREKQVSLPYHRPKALSLKDLMNRRKPTVASDGKAFPIKMNNDQLKQYVLLLEQRQKEVIELCKSDTEEEDCLEEEVKTINDESTDTTEQIILSVITQPSLEDKIICKNVKETNSNSETDCINSDNVIENVETCHSHSLEQQTRSLLPAETEKRNEPVNLEQHDEYSENDVNNVLRNEDDITIEEPSENQSMDKSVQNTEKESQNMELHYDSETIDVNLQNNSNNKVEAHKTETHFDKVDDFLDYNFNDDEINKLIENAEIICDETLNKNELFSKNADTFSKPKLTGAPGMVIDLDPLSPKQLTGIDLLKERFTYFAKIKTLEDMEKDREKKFKPGTQHLKLKQELEQKIAEQRSIEWEKRLEEEQRLKSEIKADLSDDDIEKLEAKLDGMRDEDEIVNKSSESEGEEEPVENDIILVDEPRKRNPMVDEEAEESECDEDIADDKVVNNDEVDEGNEADLEEEEDDDETTDDSSESESEDIDTKPRKGRILKAFEDSDDESSEVVSASINCERNPEIINEEINTSQPKEIVNSEDTKDTQDEELQLAQVNKSSEDLFSTQESVKSNVTVAGLNKNSLDNISADLGTQTFSILDSLKDSHDIGLNYPKLSQDDIKLNSIGTCSQNTLTTDIIVPQSLDISEDVVALCTGKFYDNPFVSQDDHREKTDSPVQLTAYTPSQEIGDDIAALCTGKFYDNPFVSQIDIINEQSETLSKSQAPEDDVKKVEENTPVTAKNVETAILNSILEELGGPDFEKPKNKYFPSNTQSKDRSTLNSSQMKKKLVIDSDDDMDDNNAKQKLKKAKKRKAEDRALQISDDEEEEEDLPEDENDIESDIEEDEERIVEYDSEENEVEVQQKIPKKKRVGAFFENEAELTSEDEWVGSGDEDERGLDRMEREEGDDDTFHQGQLQRELGQIHMREVLDQDKREVRLIQELLFEDGDLGDGHRQRKFRWRNADGEEETGTNPNELLETQEEEFESEEQWRKQRHEREMFLRKLQEKDDSDLDTSINRTAIIKANLSSRSMSMLLSENKGNKTEKEETVIEKKSTKDVPSPKKTFTIFQQNYHGSLLTRGRGALARLAALATPLAVDSDDTQRVVTATNRRNFVFTALSQDEQPKVTKRKAENNVHTPRLIKKMKTEDSHKNNKSSLFDYLNS